MRNTRLLDVRELLDFPDNGDNVNDTVFGDVHFNTNTLNHFNYSLYSNGTISNGSKCFLTFPPYEPKLLFENGTFVNATSCYSPIDPIATRGFVGIAFAVGFGLALVLQLTALTKHGKQHLPNERRFYPIGRRWQWYWGCFVCAAALISLFTNVEVDRYYLQDLPFIVSVFFWYLMCQGTVALCWEAVRHWGSWLERQYIDPNPFVYRDDDRRARMELWMPLWTYFWIWMNFFMVVPRSWNFVKQQRSQEQTEHKAIPSATSARFKAAGFMLVIAWITILFSMRHSIRFYRPRNRGLINRAVGFAQSVPLRFLIIIPLTGALIAYQIIISFFWDFSIVKKDGNIAIIYGWGYGPVLLILYIQCLYGYFTPNEDREILRQRRERGDAVDRELGYVKKPAWWRRVKGEHIERSMRDKIFANVNEVGGGHATGRRIMEDQERYVRDEALREAREDDAYNDGIELCSMGVAGGVGGHNPRVDRAGARTMAAQNTTRPAPLDTVIAQRQGAAGPSSTVTGETMTPPPPYASPEERGRRSSWLQQQLHPVGVERANSQSTTHSVNVPPQQVRSMLDV